MKKVLFLFLGLFMAFSLAGCLGSDLKDYQRSADADMANVALNAASINLLILQHKNEDEERWTITSKELVENGYIDEDPFVNVVTFRLIEGDPCCYAYVTSGKKIQVGDTVLFYDDEGEDATYKFLPAE